MSLADIALIKPVARVALDTLDVSGAPVAALQTPTITPQPGGNPGGGIFMAQSDVLAITAMSNTAGLQVIVTGRMVNLQGGSLPFQYPLTLPNAYTAYSITPNLGGGYLQSLVLTPAVPLTVGQQIYATAGLQSPGLSISTPYAMLFGGYIGNTWQSGWPGGIFQKPTDGPGCIVAIQMGPDGSSFPIPDLTTPAAVIWDVTAALLVYQLSAVAGSRQLVFEVSFRRSPADEEFIVISSPQFSDAGDALNLSWSSGGALASVIPYINVPLPTPLRVPGGQVLRMFLRSGDPGDTYSNATWMVREWLVLA